MTIMLVFLRCLNTFLGRRRTLWTWCFAIKGQKVRMIQTHPLCRHAPCIAHHLQLKSPLPLSQHSLQLKENQSVGATARSPPIRCVLYTFGINSYLSYFKNFKHFDMHSYSKRSTCTAKVI